MGTSLLKNTSTDVETEEMELKGGRYVSETCMNAEKRFRYVLTIAPGGPATPEEVDRLLADIFREIKARSITITRYDPKEHEMVHVNMTDFKPPS